MCDWYVCDSWRLIKEHSPHYRYVLLSGVVAHRRLSPAFGRRAGLRSCIPGGAHDTDHSLSLFSPRYMGDHSKRSAMDDSTVDCRWSRDDPRFVRWRGGDLA